MAIGGVKIMSEGNKNENKNENSSKINESQVDLFGKIKVSVRNKMQSFEKVVASCDKTTKLLALVSIILEETCKSWIMWNAVSKIVQVIVSA